MSGSDDIKKLVEAMVSMGYVKDAHENFLYKGDAKVFVYDIDVEDGKINAIIMDA